MQHGKAGNQQRGAVPKVLEDEFELKKQAEGETR